MHHHQLIEVVRPHLERPRHAPHFHEAGSLVQAHCCFIARGHRQRHLSVLCRLRTDVQVLALPLGCRIRDAVVIAPSLQRCLEQAIELAREVDRHPGVHGALLVKEALPSAGGEHAFVPDAGVDVQALVAGKAEADESLGRDVITRQGQRDVKGLAVQREEELTAVRVVIGMPKQHPAGLTAMIVAGLWRVGGVRQDVVSGDRFILPVKNVALPIADENALRGAGFIAGVFVHGPGARRGPANNLDGAKFRVIDQMTVAFEAAVSGLDDGHDDRRQTAWNVRVEEVEYRHNLVILSRGRPIPPAEWPPATFAFNPASGTPGSGHELKFQGALL